MKDYWIEYPTGITRVEVIDKTGRVYVKYGVKAKVSIQDNQRTLNLFVSEIVDETNLDE